MDAPADIEAGAPGNPPPVEWEIAKAKQKLADMKQHLTEYKELLEEQTADVELGTARGSVQQACEVLLAVLGQQPTEAEARAMADDLLGLAEAEQCGVFEAVENALAQEEKQQEHADPFRSELPQDWSRFLVYVFWRFVRFICCTAIIDTSAACGLPLYTWYLRIACGIIWPASVAMVVLCIKRLAPYSSLWVVVSALVFVITSFGDKDFAARVASVKAQQDAESHAQGLPDRLPERPSFTRLRAALQGCAARCEASLQRDKLRLALRRRWRLAAPATTTAQTASWTTLGGQSGCKGGGWQAEVRSQARAKDAPSGGKRSSRAAAVPAARNGEKGKKAASEKEDGGGEKGKKAAGKVGKLGPKGGGVKKKKAGRVKK
eukprot:scaffold7.g3409.t1